MKSNLLSVLALAILLPFAAISQQRESPCNVLPHLIFKGETTKKPVLLKALGTSPQFGEIPKHTAKSAYEHLKKVYQKNSKGSRKEIDNLLVALGYSGFNDPSFSANNITPEFLPKGTTGWMGAYGRKGHKYAWSTLGKEFETFKLSSKDGICTLYIMKKCGNAYYIPVPPCKPGVISPGCPCVDGYPTPDCKCDKMNAYLPANCPPVTTCQSQVINFTGKGQIQSGDVFNSSKTMEIVGVNGSSKDARGLCLGSYTVSSRATYEYSVKGESSFSKTIPVCVEGNNAPAAMNLVLPMNLNYKITKQDVKVGDGDKIYLNLDDVQFKALSKAYKSCSVGTPTALNSETFTKKVLSGNATDAVGATSSNGIICADQRINFIGTTQIQDGSFKSSNQDVTIIATYRKTGKLAVGETADKYLCLGNFQVPVKSSYEVLTTGGSNVSKPFRVCTADGKPLPDQNINVPVNLNYNFTKQDVMVGDYNKIYVGLDEKQFNALSKIYKRCCANGSIGNCK